MILYVHEFQFLAKVKATSTGKLLDSLHRTDAMVIPFSGKLNVAFYRDL
jgi:hypothetical protein